MAEAPNGVIVEPKPSRKGATPLRGVAKAAVPLLALGVTFGVGAVADQGGLRPVAVSAAGETPTPTPTPDSLLAKIEAQKAHNAALATQVAVAEKTKNDQATKVADLNKAQNEFNALQDRLTAARNPVLSPPDRATATRQAQLSEQATRIANADAVSTRVRGEAAATSTSAAATATRASDIARATVTENAIINREQARKKETKDMLKTLLGWFGLSGGAIGVGAAVKYRGVLKNRILTPIKKFFNF